MKALGTLLKTSMLQALRSEAGWGGTRFSFRILLPLAGLGFAALLYDLMSRFLDAMAAAPLIGEILARRVLDMGLWSLLFLTFTSALTQSLGLLLMAEDLFLIRVSPLPRGQIFAARFLLTYISSCWAALALAGPLLGPYARTYGGGFLGWLAASLVFLLVLFLPVSLGAGAGLLLARVFPGGRVREWTALIGGLFAATLVLVIRILGPEKLMKPPEDQDPMVYLQGIEKSLRPLPGLPWTDPVFGLLQGALPLAGLFRSVLPVILASLLLAVLLQPLWRRGLESGAQGGMDSGPSALARLLGKPGALRAMVLKNAGLFLREPSQGGQVLLFLMLGGLYGINLRALPRDLYGGLLGLIGFLNLGFAGLLAAAFLSRFLFPSLSGEGRPVWVLLSSPAPLRRYLALQLALAVLNAGLMLAGLHGWTRASLIPEAGLPLAVLLASITQALGLSFLTAGLGLRAARFDLSPASRILMTIPGLICLLAQAAYVALGLAFLAIPVRQALWRGTGAVADPRGWGPAVFGLALLVLITFVFWYRSLRQLRDLGSRLSA